MTQAGAMQRCWRCKEREAIHVIRSDHICSDCFCRFAVTKTVKRLGALSRETRGFQNQLRAHPNGNGNAASNTKTFYVGLSFGPSSAALVDICEQIILGQLAKGRDAAFTLHVVHIDTELAYGQEPSSPAAGQRLERWRERYPRFTFECVPLAEALALDSIDWSALRTSGTQEVSTSDGVPQTPASAEQVQAILAGLPSATSRRDVLDLLVRRLLIARAAAAADSSGTGGCSGLLLGCSTTALAERTLAETAKGRGFSLPWQINDGPVDESGNKVPLYYPVRELFRKELVLYTNVTQPPLPQDLLLSPSSPLDAQKSGGGAVVSHKDLSIEEVMARYFAEVEENYPSVVANVVRTTAKLERHGHSHGHGKHDEDAEEDSDRRGQGEASCRVCGMPLDEAGNKRWKGEIGELDHTSTAQGPEAQRLCYGCERSIHG